MEVFVYILNFIRGFCMALADSVPGVSGGTIAFILGFYDDFVNSLNNIIISNNKTDRINAFKLKHYYGAKLSPFACLIDNNGKHIQAFYSENKSFSLDYIKNVLDHWLLYNPIEDGNSGN